VQWTATDDLARATVDLVGDPVKRATMADSARRRALEFSVDVFAERVRTLAAPLSPP
jgi:hypothetical protein